MNEEFFDIDFEFTPIFTKNMKATARTVVNVGGARSTKSHSIAQVFIYKLITEKNKHFGITRKTGPALAMTAEKLFIDLLKEYKIYNQKDHNKSNRTYDFFTSRVQFFSLDDPEKIKSTEFNYIWMEEANEFKYQDYLTLLTRMSGPTIPSERNQIFISLNPIDFHTWVRTKVSKAKDVEVIHSTWKDNPFLSDDYVQLLKDLELSDPLFYKVYALGLWGQLKGIIYPNYKIIPKMPPDSIGEVIYAIDFGFNNPSCILKIIISGQDVFIQEILYQTELTNGNIVKFIQEEIGDENRHRYIFADSAEPDRIQEIYNEGFNVNLAAKSVLDGIDVVKRKNLYITSDSVNTLKEIQTYSWKQNKEEQLLDEPIKINDHAMDAMRYGIYSYVKEFQPQELEFSRKLRYAKKGKNK